VKKCKLILDANVIIHLFKIELWKKITESYDVLVAGTVIQETKFYEDFQKKLHTCNLEPYSENNLITIFELEPSDLKVFRDKFDPLYLERLDPGETESLAYLLIKESEDILICSSDAIVFRILGALLISEKGISLEEVLQHIGFTRNPEPCFRKRWRDKWTRTGFEEGLYGIGKRQGK
jgi:hypothetical protein